MVNTYINGYQCSIDDKGKEVVITGLLTIPTLNSELDKMEAKTESVSSLIMSLDTATKLSESLADLIEKAKQRNLEND